MPPLKPSPNNKNQTTTTHEFKHKVLTCLNKLSDRDTHSAATSELETIAKTLPATLISSFLTSITATEASDKYHVRKTCVRLISTLSESHGDVLTTTHFKKLVSAVVNRLRDPDTSVRSACVDATRAIAMHVTKPPFTAVVTPFVDVLVQEQEFNSQVGVCLCLAAVIDGAHDPEVGYLRKMVVPRIEKLLRCESFKAKAALVTVLGSVIGVGGVSGASGGPGVVKNVVSVLVEFVGKSEDWSVRKAAAEALEKLAVVEADLLVEYKASCLKTFEAKKFDKVKTVREAMIRMIEAWKAIPDVMEEALTPPDSHSSSKAEIASDGRYPLITNKRNVPNRMPATTATRRTSLENSSKKTGQAMFRKLDRKKPNDQTASSCSVDDDHLNNKSVKPETKRALFSEMVNEQVQESESEHARLSTNVVENDTAEAISKSDKDTEELSLIRKQLAQIETQQSNLLDLLQKYIGSSQTGMQSLETRVHGLELTLDEISFDLARSTGRLSHPESVRTSCCKLPGADFFTSKLWKKTEVQHAKPRILSSAFASTSHMTGKNMSLRREGGGSGLIKNPLAEVRRDDHGSS